MKKLLQEFKEFALRGNVMDLAVGVIIGAAFQAIINSLVNDVISPLIGLFANTDLTYLSVMVGDVEIRYGAFLTAVINFIIMAVIIFLMVKGMNALAGLGKKEEGAGKTCCENVPLLQKQGCGRGNPLSVLYVYAGSEKKKKKK